MTALSILSTVATLQLIVSDGPTLELAVSMPPTLEISDVGVQGPPGTGDGSPPFDPSTLRVDGGFY